MSFEQAFLQKPICHRALHDKSLGRAENSLEAIEAAIAIGLPIEIDLQETKDARAVVFHDDDLKRLTGETGKTNERTLAQMEALPLLDGGHTISYQKLLDLVDGRVPILVEIKDQSGELGPKIGDFMPDIITSTQKYSGAIALMSFNPYITKALGDALPNHPIGLTTDAFRATSWPNVPIPRLKNLRVRQEIPALRYDFISHNWLDLERVKNLDLPKLCWTVKSPRDEKTARRIAGNITFEAYMPDDHER